MDIATEVIETLKTISLQHKSDCEIRTWTEYTTNLLNILSGFILHISVLY